MLSPAASGPEADGLFSAIDFSGGAIVAVSGGGDSTALLLLARHYLDRAFPAGRLVAVTVDHGLRPESAAEAGRVAQLCRRHDIAHRIMRWTGAKPATGLPAAARAARYGLLAQAAREEGAGMVLTGHTADDQAETVLMRRARSVALPADTPGLAGMAPATLYDGAVWIMRPLLGTRRAALRTWLADRGVDWSEDPTNADTAFERPRARAALGASGDAGIAEALALAAEAAELRVDLGRRAATLMARHATLPSAGLLRLAPAFMEEPDRAAVLHALRILLAAAGGADLLPDRAGAAALLEKLAGWRTPHPLRATLSHAVADRRAAGLFLHRERRSLPAAAPVRDGMIWDGRYRITLRDGGSGFLIAPAGAAPVGRSMPQVEGAPQALVRAALAAEPALVAAGAGDALRFGGAADPLRAKASPVVAPFARFLSGFDLAPARAAAALIGADAVPEPPWTGRTDRRQCRKA